MIIFGRHGHVVLGRCHRRLAVAHLDAVQHHVDQIVASLARFTSVTHRTTDNVREEARLGWLEKIERNQAEKGLHAGQEADHQQQELAPRAPEHVRGVLDKVGLAVGEGLRVDAERTGRQRVQAELAEDVLQFKICFLWKKILREFYRGPNQDYI